MNKYVKIKENKLVLDNGCIYREIKLPDPVGEIYTKKYSPGKEEFPFFREKSEEFSFFIDGKKVTGNSRWILEDVHSIEDENQGLGVEVELRSHEMEILVKLQYLLYPEMPCVRKKLVIKNISKKALSLEAVDVESLMVVQYEPVWDWIYSDYGRKKSIGPFRGGIQDSLVMVHNIDRKLGLVIGNEAPGVNKSTTVYWGDCSIVVGLPHQEDPYAFRKKVLSQEEFETPQVFTMIYENVVDANEVLNTYVSKFVRKYMGICLSKCKEKPLFVYNTWAPFRHDINAPLISQLAKAAAECGIKEFVIDDGWQKEYGDWEVDRDKFPEDLGPVMKEIQDLGMKAGLWLSIGTASKNSKVFAEHPEWFVEDKNGNPISLLNVREENMVTACFGTPWYEHIKKILVDVITRYHLDYLKLDFSVVSSPYRYKFEDSGCYSKSHEGHCDRNESFYSNFVIMWKLFDELHKVKPDLFIDCTFETMGGLQLIDYAMLQHAEGNWLSNFEKNVQTVDWRIRQMAWWRSPAMPATSLVIGNAEIHDETYILHILSLFGCLPMMLGDLRKLPDEKRKIIREYSKWLECMEKKYDILSYRQDLKGFREPQEGCWDGFQRINEDHLTGGIFGIFRQNSVERKRMVTIQFLKPEDLYEVVSMDGKVIAQKTGKELEEIGVEIELPNRIDGAVYEVKLVDIYS